MTDSPTVAARVSGRSRRTVLDELDANREGTRGQLMLNTRLSRATIAAVVTELLAEGLLEEDFPAGSSGRGRRAGRLRLAPPKGLVGAIDLGRSHIAVALGRVDSPASHREWRAHPADSDPRTALGAAIDLLEGTVRVDPGRLLVMGVAVPHPISDPGGVTPDGPWGDVDIAAEVRRRLGVPTVLENDGNAGAVAEARGDAVSVLHVKVSTGIGAGLFVNGDLVRGAGGKGGELGHVVINRNGQLCRCGNRGCLETMASIAAVMRALGPVHGPVSAVDLAALLEAGDPVACRAMSDAGEALGTAVAPIAAVLELDRVSISGPRDIPITLVAEGAKKTLAQLVHPDIAGRMRIAETEAGYFAPLEGVFRLASAHARALARN